MLLPTAGGPLDAVVTVPGSKSIANRALVCAALADGDSVLRGLPRRRRHRSDGPLPGRARRRDDRSTATTATVNGTGGRLRSGPVRLDAALAGTTSRFVTAVAALADGPVTIDGAPPLRRRPMGPLHDALVAARRRPIGTDGGAGHLPVTVRGPLRARRHGSTCRATCPASSSPR